MWRAVLVAGLALLWSAAAWAQDEADRAKLVVMPLQTSDLAASSVATLDELLVDVHAPTPIESGPLVSAPWYAWGIDLLVGGALLVASQVIQAGPTDQSVLAGD